MERVSLDTCQSPASMSKWLSERGLDTTMWGRRTDTKSVKELCEEVINQEAGLVTWRREDGSLFVVREAHVLRAVVCSKGQREGPFLFNTWQQFADGRKRSRNALLSEKLFVNELPLEHHLHAVCARTISEEMCRLESCTFCVQEGVEVPPFDSESCCSVEVMEEVIVDTAEEIEYSKSYPGLLTWYKLYTVEVVCQGIPECDFNTLEYLSPKGPCALRDLKCVHAWTWRSVEEINKYLGDQNKLKPPRAGAQIEERSHDPEDAPCHFAFWNICGLRSTGCREPAGCSFESSVLKRIALLTRSRVR